MVPSKIAICIAEVGTMAVYGRIMVALLCFVIIIYKNAWGMNIF